MDIYFEETPDNRLCVVRRTAEVQTYATATRRGSHDKLGQLGSCRDGCPCLPCAGDLILLQPLTMNTPGEAPDLIENRTFNQISVGDSASLTRTLSRDDIALFAVMSGDVTPAHLDERYAEGSMFHRIIAHGMWGDALVSAVLGTRLPGPRTIYRQVRARVNSCSPWRIRARLECVP